VPTTVTPPGCATGTNADITKIARTDRFNMGHLTCSIFNWNVRLPAAAESTPAPASVDCA
jgi:hypothetical protein